MSIYTINKGVGKEVEFQGLKAQYLFLFAGGLLAIFLLVLIVSMVGVNQIASILLGVIAAVALVWFTFYLNGKYGTYGLMKLAAVGRYPRRIIHRKCIMRLIKEIK